ncbi:MAG: replication-associated recombination protein A [Bryobacterales bacterium]|nr:replication-associated recombination protein A [Bryobacterales bacterium]
MKRRGSGCWPPGNARVSLFDQAPDNRAGPPRPLAERMRPETLADYLGQEHILGEGKPLRRQLERGDLTSIILWGPPGVGKTTLARILSRQSEADFVPFSAVMSGIKEVRAVMEEAGRARSLGRRTLIFVDEIHRFNKAQQDAFLPYVERGDVILIGATTENPSFEVISALLSRTRVYALRPLSAGETAVLLRRAVTDRERGLGELELSIGDELLAMIAAQANGDARSALNLLEIVAAGTPTGVVTRQTVEDAMQRKMLLYDKSGEEHFNIISALHKSVRSSDPDAALYWLARMLEAGEDRLYIARRLVRMAIEDIGLADPRALEQAMAAKECFHFLGEPEGDLALAQVVIYLAVAPKSDAGYRALGAAREAVRSLPAEPVPLHLRNAPTRAMKEWGYGEGYQHAHQFADALVSMQCLPPSLAGTRFYNPVQRGLEIKIAERLEQLRAKRSQVQDKNSGEDPTSGP